MQVHRFRHTNLQPTGAYCHLFNLIDWSRLSQQCINENRPAELALCQTLKLHATFLHEKGRRVNGEEAEVTTLNVLLHPLEEKWMTSSCTTGM